MQFRVIPALIVFVGSYLPLSLILLAQNYDYDAVSKPICLSIWTSECALPFKNANTALTIFWVSGACFVSTLVVLSWLKPKTGIVIRSAVHVPADLMNYTLPYVVSFMSIDYQDVGKFVGLIIFLLWMFWITYRSGQIILNPLLIAFGWRLYDVTYTFSGSKTEHSARVLSQGSLAPNERHRQIAVQDIYIIKPDRQGIA